MPLLLSAVSISDPETAETMRQVYDETGYILDPHGAVAYRALYGKLSAEGGRGILLGTAHPAKFDSVADILGSKPARPPQIDELFKRERSCTEIGNQYAELKEVIVRKI